MRPGSPTEADDTESLLGYRFPAAQRYTAPSPGVASCQASRLPRADTREQPMPSTTSARIRRNGRPLKSPLAVTSSRIPPGPPASGPEKTLSPTHDLAPCNGVE